MQAQYRLGSSLLAREKYQEAMKPFSKSLQLLLKDASSSENDKVDTLTQLLSVALNLPGTTETNQRLFGVLFSSSVCVPFKRWHVIQNNFFSRSVFCKLKSTKVPLGKFYKYLHNKETLRQFPHQAYSPPGYLNAWLFTWYHWLTNGRKEWMNARMHDYENVWMYECSNARMHE